MTEQPAFTRRTRRIEHREYEMRSPVSVPAFMEAMATAHKEITRDLGLDTTDEILRIEARGDKVVLTWYSEDEEPRP